MKDTLEIHPQGIVRNVPATLSKPEHCETVLNLRPQGGGWKTVGQKLTCHEAYAEGADLIQTSVHQMPTANQLVAVRRLADGSFQVAASALGVSAPMWQVLVALPSGTLLADALQVHIAFIGNFCCVSTPNLRVFRFNGTAYVEETTAADSPPAVNYSVQGRYTSSGSLLSFTLPVRGENLEGCYYREQANRQYPDELLNADTESGVVLNQGTNNTPKQWGNLVFGEAQGKQVLEAMAGEYEALMQSSATYREGYVLVCSAWQLADGSFTCPSEPLLLHLGCEDLPTDFMMRGPHLFDPETDIDVLFNRDKICIRQFSANGIQPTADVNAVLSCHVRRQWVQQLTFTKPTVPGGGSEVFRKAVYFVSPPVSMYRLASAEFQFLHTIHHYGIDYATQGLVEGNTAYYRLALKHAPYHREGLTEYLPSAADVASWLLYKAVEFDMTDRQEKETKTVNFSTLTSGELLNADLAGHLSISCGGLMAYNQRLHLWNCSSTIKGNPVVNYTLSSVAAGYIRQYVEARLNDYVTERLAVNGLGGTPFVRCVGQLDKRVSRQVIVQFRIANGKSFLYHYRTLRYQQRFTDAGDNVWQALPRFVSFPDSRCDQCTLFFQNEGGDWRSVGFAMHPSGGFNFSFAIHLAESDGMNSAQGAYLPLTGGTAVSTDVVNRMKAADGQTFSQPIGEQQGAGSQGRLLQSDLLMVSEVDNPYVFPPELAFHFGAPITAAEVAMREISAVQTGQYPLCVFTGNGIWCMELGSEAFYSRQIPISAEVNVGSRVLSTPFGIVFLAEGGVKLLKGREVQRLDALATGGVCSAMWASPSLASLCKGGSALLSESARLADEHLVSPKGINQFLTQNVALGYDARHHELLISSAANGVPLTYVYSFPNQQWFTVSDSFYSFSGGLGVRKEADGNVLCRLTAEMESGFRPIALVSRPFAPLHLNFKHLNRLHLRGELAGGAPAYSGLYVLASNNLEDWRMVSAVQWQHALSPQVRLQRGKASWRFYAIALFADVPSHFWLSHCQWTC